MIYGIDISSYQGPGVPGIEEPLSFVIINVRDPGLETKCKICRDELGIPWGGYSWIDPGVSQDSVAGWAADRVRAAGEPPLGLWADYEQDGVDDWQLTQFRQRCDGIGIKSGYYANGWRPNHDLHRGWAFWQAAYPGRNDGSFPGFGNMPVYRDTQIWQYSSSGGFLDRNVIVDEAWFYSFVGGVVVPAPEPPAPTPKEERPMAVFVWKGPAGKELVELQVGTDGKVRQTSHLTSDEPGVDPRWVTVGAVRAEGVDPNAAIDHLKAGEYDGSEQFFVRGADGVSTVHIWLGADGQWGAETHAAQAVAPPIVPPGVAPEGNVTIEGQALDLEPLRQAAGNLVTAAQAVVTAIPEK